MTTTRRLNDSNKVIVTAALTGAVTTKQDNPYLPTQPKEIAEAALRCYEAGAAMVHIRVRDDNDAGSMRFDKFEEAVGLIRATGCPVLLNLTSSGGQGFSWEERIRPFRELRPEMASFDAGTMNWLHSVVFMNEPKFLELCGQEMRAAGVKPEIEVFDMGMLNTAKHYLKTGVLDAPAHFQLCLGTPGGMEANTESLVYLVNHLPENCTWSTFGIGRGANEITLAALAMGGNIRVGLEDNVYYNKGVFGLGHIINLVNGAELLPTFLQIIYATAIGFLFTMLFHKGKCLWPCIITHSVVNTLSVIGVESTTTEKIISAVILTAVSLGYTALIYKNKKHCKT